MDTIAEQRFWELSDPPEGVYPTLDQWSAVIAEVHRQEAERARRIAMTEAREREAQERLERAREVFVTTDYPRVQPAVYASSGAYEEELSSCSSYVAASSAAYVVHDVNTQLSSRVTFHCSSGSWR